MNNFAEQQFIKELKCRLLDIILGIRTPILKGNLCESLLEALKKTAFIEGVMDFYHFGEWDESIYLVATNRSVKSNVSQVQEKLPFDKLSRGKVFRESFSPNRMMLVLKHNDSLAGAIVIEGNSGILRMFSDCILEQVADEISRIVFQVSGLEKIEAEKQRYRQLHRVTEKFHSTMNVDDVLSEIIHTLQDVYPGFEYYLLLSQDNSGHGELPVKTFEYNSNNLSAMQAYVNGTLQIEDSLLERKSILYAPLKGRQGVYGVLQVIAPDSQIFPGEEREFICLLANTAGSALENAQLYQQSRKLVSDLQLINDTTHVLNSNLRLTDTVQYVTSKIKTSLDADEVGFFWRNEESGELEVLDGSTPFFVTGYSKPELHSFGVMILERREPIFIGDAVLLEESQYSAFRSIMGVPIKQNNQVKGYALILNKEPYAFTFEEFKLLQSLVYHSSLAFSNAMLKEQLEELVITDHLTKLFSRSYLDEIMHISMERDMQGAFILIDIDNFKLINDTHGHQTGDEVLIQLARLTCGSIRASDISARWGGEELAIYIPGGSIHVGIRTAERLVCMAIKNTFPPITISCGVSSWKKESGDTVESLFRRADQALYEAKKSGKNKVVAAKEDMTFERSITKL
ncbi:sensor domain-containing diguanylate cyclase [Bacillus massilinigeriensis]|uniref:sensor domain-containing diguanylate cyclase n=1 Tax=Bacillus mediterraneensis TaxID=1805474 RepID=UPI0008F85CE1|nr:diguanylate cyclase [Bacillus mediterraneensis]